MSHEPMDAWADLPEPWPMCFRLAWESFRAGSVPVGAVLVDAGGAVVATGRNRRGEPTGPTVSSPAAASRMPR